MSDDLVKRTYHRGARDFGTGYDMMVRIVELEAALAKADALAGQCDDAFYHTDAVGLPEFYQSLTAYREARK